MFCPNSHCSESSHDPLCLHLMISSHRALAAFPKDNRMWIEETHLRYRIMKPCPKFRSMSSPLRFCFRIFKGITPQNKKSQSIGNIYVMIRPKLGTGFTEVWYKVGLCKFLFLDPKMAINVWFVSPR